MPIEERKEPEVSVPRVVLILVGLAVLVRTILALNTCLIGTDSRQFLVMAERLFDGNFNFALAMRYHPLYSMMTAMGHFVIPTIETSAVVVSILFGSLAVLPLFVLTRDIWGHRIALITCLFYIFSPPFVEVQADVMSEGLFIFLFLSGLALLWKTLRTPQWAYFVIVGLLGGLAYLTRLEGILIPLVGALWIGIGMLTPPDRRTVGRFVLGGVLMLAVFCVLGYPYVLWVHKATGEWRPSAKGSYTTLIKSADESVEGPESSASPSGHEGGGTQSGEWKKRWGVFGDVAYFAYTTLKAAYFIPMFFILIGLGRIRKTGVGWRPLLFLLSFVVTYYGSLFVALEKEYALSTRYLLPIMTLILPLGAFGLLETFQWIWTRFFFRYGEDRMRRTFAVVLVVLLLGMLPKALGRRRYDEISYRQAGEWIKPQVNPRDWVIGSEKVAWYAHSSFHGARSKFSDTVSEIARRKASFLAIEERALKELDKGFLEQCTMKYGPPKIFPESEGTHQKRVYVYMVRDTW